MNSWKNWDRVLNVFSWTMLGAAVVLLVLRFVLPTEVYADICHSVGWVMPVLLAGAIGYVTNWVALWYLFKPYEPRFFGILYGIIPRKKKEMAVSIGNLVGKTLLNPEALVEEMKDEVMAFVNDPQRLSVLRAWVQRYFAEHQEELVEFVTPFAERQVMDVLDSVATDETWGRIWDEGILPRIKNEKSREFIVNKLVDALRENAGDIVENVRAELRPTLYDRLIHSSHWYVRFFAPNITNYVMDNIATYDGIKSKLDEWLSRGETQARLREKLVEYADQMTTWMKGDEGTEVMGGMVREIKVRGKRFLATYIREKMPGIIDRVFDSQTLRDRLERRFLPKVGARLVELIGENKQVILDKLRLEERVKEAVDRMDAATFHRTMKGFLDENLCAVQVLGFALGAGVGFLQLVIKIG